MKKYAALIALFLTTGALFAADPAPKVGIVNFTTCVTDSKVGKQEQSSFESLKKQMTTLVEDTEKQLRDLSEKFNDKDFLDGLSPDAEAEMKVKFQTLSEELGRYQNQYYQVLQQANYKLLQTVSGTINSAAEKVASGKGLNMIVNKEACFYYLPALDITSDVIKEMDKNFELDAKKQAAAPAPTPAPAEKVEAKR